MREGEEEAVEEPEAEGEDVEDAEGDRETDTVGELVKVGLALWLPDTEPLLLSEAVAEGVVVTV